MQESVDLTADIARLAEQLLEVNFGERPASLQVFHKPPFTFIHLHGFLMPSEKLLLQKDKTSHIMKTRDLLMQSIKPEFLQELEKITGAKTTELYTDWNLDKATGIFLAVSDQEASRADFEWPVEADAEAILEIIRLNSQRTQKLPDRINFFWLTDHLLVIERQGILIDIEKQLIGIGVVEELRQVKRPLEHRVIKLFNLEAFVNKAIIDLFVDWDFKADKGYMILLMEKES